MLLSKLGTSYRPGQSHGVLRVNTLDVNDSVLTGSHSFMHAARADAANVLSIASPGLAGKAVAHARHLAERRGH